MNLPAVLCEVAHCKDIWRDTDIWKRLLQNCKASLLMNANEQLRRFVGACGIALLCVSRAPISNCNNWATADAPVCLCILSQPLFVSLRSPTSTPAAAAQDVASFWPFCCRSSSSSRPFNVGTRTAPLQNCRFILSAQFPYITLQSSSHKKWIMDPISGGYFKRCTLYSGVPDRGSKGQKFRLKSFHGSTQTRWRDVSSLCT